MLDTKPRQAFGLFVCATIIQGIIDAPIELNWDAIGYLLGQGIAITLLAIGLASILVAPFRLAAGKWPAWHIWAAWLMAPVVILINTPSAWQESFDDTQSAVSWFSGDGRCSLAVGFPGTPETWEGHLPNETTISGAHYNTREGFHLRAECVDFAAIVGSEVFRIETAEWVQMMWDFADLEGLQDLQIFTRQKSLDGRPITVVEGRGYKSIADIKAIALIRLIHDGNRSLSLTVLGPADRFPNRAAGEFLERYRWAGNRGHP